jgi:23S rRNA (cytosine1962-C5)-methyltransferase
MPSNFRRKPNNPPRLPRQISNPSPAPLSPPADAVLPVVTIGSEIRHPSIYKKRISDVEGFPEPGDWVAVKAEPKGNFLGYGIYNPMAEISLRVVRYTSARPDNAYFEQLLLQAISLRHDVLRLHEKTDTYRLIHAESDGFPGLVIDRFGDTLSAEAFSLGMFQRAPEILQMATQLLGTKHWLVQPSPHSLEQEGFSSESVGSENVPSQVTVQEYGTRFRVRFEGGHKTGFFCDQRENRKLLTEFTAGKSVLDLCCYSGGFAIQAKVLGKAEEVVAVDLDEAPLQQARENANLNSAKIKFTQSDVFPYMRDLIRIGKQFDVVVLDPPKLIRSREEIEEGTRKHFDLNRLAMQCVKPGGILLTCTCAGLLAGDEFQRLVISASKQAGPLDGTLDDGRPRHAARPMQILHRTGAAPDHPISAWCPETEYLTAIWARMG